MQELIGNRPSILKSGVQDAGYYQRLWQTILRGEPWTDETVERRKDGSTYTVLQTITPIRGEGGEITHFVSIHEDITARKAIDARIRHLAHHDGLTGLANRAFFYE
jgi:PAS domain S-box-containing protein